MGAFSPTAANGVMLINAGFMLIAPTQFLKVDGWNGQIDLTIRGLHKGCRLPQMQQQNTGQLINLAPVLGSKVSAPSGASSNGVATDTSTFEEGKDTHNAARSSIARSRLTDS